MRYTTLFTNFVTKVTKSNTDRNDSLQFKYPWWALDVRPLG